MNHRSISQKYSIHAQFFENTKLDLLEPLQLSVWAIPTAIAAFIIHGARLWWLDRRLARKAAL